MSLLDKYIEKSKSENFFASENEFNPYLFCFTRNFRNILMFEEGWSTYSDICAMTDEQFAVYIEQQPEQAKSFITNMNRTKLFMSKGGKRVPSAKGEVYEKFLLEKLGKDERWFINYLFIVDSYFNLCPNYIFRQTDKVFDKWIAAGYTPNQIYNILIYLFNIRESNREEYLRSEYMMMLTFIDDTAFLDAYRTASEFERGEVHDYIVDNYVKERYNDPVSAKFSPASPTDFDTVLDDAKILFFSHYLMNSHPISLEDMLDKFAQIYTRFYKLNRRKTDNFIMMYADVFGMTYINLFSDTKDFYLDLNVDDETIASSYDIGLLGGDIDYTTTECIDTLAKINAVLSVIAKRENDYKCELDDCGCCRYFTSKATGKPYLEIHQLIPRAYANEFSVSVERPGNYIPLCPHCHRLIHEATDAERFRVLSRIYEKRKARLEADGIIPTNELLLSIYGIEQPKLPPAYDFMNPQLERPQPKLDVPQPKLAAGKGASSKKPAAKKSPAKKPKKK